MKKITKNKKMNYIFDLDGCVLDTQTPLHATAECRVLKKYGITINPNEISERFAGIPTKKVFKELAPSNNPDVLEKEKWEIIEKLIEEKDFSNLNLLGNCCVQLKNKGYSIAIASASPKWYIKKVLDKIKIGGQKLSSYFDALVSAEEVTRPKPFPDVFLKAAEMINAKLDNCIVIGDGSSDVNGGLAANMQVVYYSKNTKFDNNNFVIRFENNKEVSDYLLKNL